MSVVSPLILSLAIASAATLLVALVALPTAHLLARRSFKGKSLVESAILLPLVLPPTVVGYLLILLIGRRGWLGQALEHLFDLTLLFTPAAAVLAAAVVSFPLLYLPARAAFASIDPDLNDLARLFGAGRLRIFWHVSIPLARRSICSGLLLTFARSLGEFGATIMVLGDLERRRTLPISIYTEYLAGDMGHAAPAVGILILVALGLAYLYNRLERL